MIFYGERVCSDCGGELCLFGSCKRIVRLGYGKKDILSVKRLRCMDCRKVHREVPRNMLPYKQYRKDIVEGFRSGRLSTCSDAFEDYPCDATIRLWNRIKIIA